MERLARLHTLLYATLPYDTRVRLAVAGILAMMRTDWYRASLNDSLREEFEKGGIPLDEDFDFFEIVHQAVTDRINPHEPDYEDFFQDVVTNLLNRRKSQGLRKEWIRDAKRLMKRGELDNLVGLLKTAAKNFVRDMFRSRETSRGREERIKTPGEEDEPGVDITRRDLGESESENIEDLVSAREIYRALLRNLRDPRSKKILEIVVKKGIMGFLTGKGVSDLARALGTSPAMATYYRDRVFKPDLLRALKRIGDRDLLERAKGVLSAATSNPTVRLCAELDDMYQGLADTE